MADYSLLCSPEGLIPVNGLQMKIAQGIRENNIVVGNTFDKYGSNNPLVRWIMKGFHDSLDSLVSVAAPGSIHEIGCGEGYWVLEWNRKGIVARGTDFSKKVIGIARENAQNRGMQPSLFSVRSIYEITPEHDAADLLVCCEVLEHLERPQTGLEALKRAASRYLVLSVPREPVWRIFNMIRGKYVRSFGNTPGHVQHWTSNSFIELVSGYFDVIAVKKPLPWTMLLCRVES